MADQKKGYQTTTSEYHGEFADTIDQRTTQAPRITPQGLNDRLGTVNVLDVRPSSELDSSGVQVHGAVQVNPDDPSWMNRLSKEQSYVVCSRTGGDTAARVALRMRDNGFRSVHILEGGLEKWKSSGFPVEAGPRKKESGEPSFPNSWINR
ncbi:MAG: rhodanese-like domain-containing protein [Desulfovibrionales bacterium]